MLRAALAGCALVAAVVACGGTRPVGVNRHPPSDVDAAFPDGSPSPTDADVFDTLPRPDVPRDLPVAALPAELSPKQIVAAGAALAGDGTSSCTAEPGDRWCAFRKPGVTGNTTELWVINVTRAAASPTLLCDGTHPDCLRLTENLWTDEPILGPRQRFAHRFDGDTLFFHADALSAADAPYTGPIFAWRPGWAKARMVAAKAYACFAHLKRALALCVDNITYDAAVPVEYDLRAGALDDAGGDVLPIVDHVLNAQANRQRAPRVAFSDDGQFVVYTSAPVVDFPTPALKRVAVGTPMAGTPVEILSDVMDWALSIDGKKVFFFSEYKDGAGRLAVADFPSGADPRASSYRGVDFIVLGNPSVGDRGVGLFIERGGRFLSEYRIIPDSNALSEAVLVFRYTNPLEDFHFSNDGQYVGYAKGDPDEGFNGYIVRTDGTRQCILNGEPNRPAFEYFFLDNSRRVFWSEESPTSSDYRDGWFGNPDGCTARRVFAERIAFYTPVGNAGLIYGDGFDVNTDLFTLKYAALENQTEWPIAGGVRIHDGVGFPVAILGPGLDQIVFQAAGAREIESGIFVFGPLPFKR